MQELKINVPANAKIGISANSRVIVVDNLTDTSSTKALSANQGKILNEKISDIISNELQIGAKDGKFSAGGANANDSGVSIGNNAGTESGVSINENATTRSGVAIGKDAYSYSGVAIGNGAKTPDSEPGGTAIGTNAKSADGGFAGGKNAKAIYSLTEGQTEETPLDAIQLGEGTNNIPKTFQVYDHQMMDADGNIPADRLAAVNWNDSAVIEHKGTIDCTDVEYTGSDNPDLQQNYFRDDNILSAEACLKRLSELKFDAISEGTVADGKRYHYWALLKLYPAEFSGSTVCEFIDDRAGIVANDGSYDSGHVRIFIINDNGIRHAFKQEYSFSYNETGSAVYDWTEWERICIGESDIADSAVTTEKLRNKAVTTAKIADNAITADKLNDDALVSAKLYAEAKANDALVNAKSYADQKFAAAKSYTDDKLTAVYKTIGLMKPDTWTEVQQIVEAGYGAAAFPVGVQFMTKHADTSLVDSQTGYIYWDVAAHQNIITSSGETKPGMILISHYALGKYLYDATEKMLDLPNGLAAGAYWFGVPDNYEPGYLDLLTGNESLCRTVTMTKSDGTEVSQTVLPITFTLSQAVPEGGYLRFVWNHATKISGAKIATYNSDSAVIESGLPVSAGADGTYLGATGITATAGGFNQIERLRYGSNNWKESNMRKYLNSTVSDGWYTPSTEYDLNGINKQGFIYGLSSAGENEFLSVVKPVQRITVTNNVYEENDSIASSYTTCDKFWIPSQTEITGTNGGAINENTLFEYFQNGKGQIKYTNAGNNTAGVRAGSWRLRTPGVTVGGSSQCVFPSLGMMTGNAASVYFAPCCAIY